jgi:hypothetical protein
MGSMIGNHGDTAARQSFEFIGFKPADRLVDRATEELSHIFSESPSDSAARAFVRKTIHGFEGRLQICSVVGTFVADVIGEDPAAVIDKLTERIRSQLHAWREQRRFPDLAENKQ